MSDLKLYVGWLREVGPAGPIDPGFGQPGGPVDPGYGRPGWGPVDPGFGRPGGGYPSHGLPIAPGHPGNKPPGLPIVPPHPGQRPPMGGAPPHPWIPGHWAPVDPGFGLPPLWGFIPVDPGWGQPETPPPTVGGGPVPPKPGAPPGPDQGLPGAGAPGVKPPGGGNWVPVDPGFGQGCKPLPPIWAWIPAPPDLSKPVPPTEAPAPAPK